MSNIIFKGFTSIKQIKEKSEFIPKGRIYPARIIRCSKKKHQHCVISGSNQYAIPTNSGYLLFVDNNDGEFEAVLTIKGVQNSEFKGSPYNGATFWQGDHETSEKDFLTIFNRKYFDMNGVTELLA